ncbi:MAG TPA: type IV pilus assembly protein PilM [Chthonomonadaceae bacterium]|nr:type IV pilus assembly protein PilM [Chthonomonadaceae bacterium]
MAGGSYVGLDIGSTQIKVAEVRRSGRGLEVTALGIAKTPVEAYENNLIVDVPILSKAVKALLKQAGVSTKQCVSSISGQSAVVVRVIEVPKMNAAELKTTMEYEVERNVPFASGGGGGVITDYVPIDRPEGVADGQNMEVLLAAAQQDTIDRHVEMLFAAGLKPVAIDVEPLAVGRTLLETGNDQQAPGHTVAIVNIGASISDVGIYRDKLLCFSRIVPIGGDTFTRAIGEHLQVDLETAERYKHEVAEVVVDPTGGQPMFHMEQTFGGGGAGFHDFTQPQESIPQSTTEASPSGRTPFLVQGQQAPSTPSSPSGRMPFDFSTPGEAPPEQSGPDFGHPADLQQDSNRMPPANQPEQGFYQPPGQDPNSFQPVAPPAHDPNLPVLAPSQGNDALKQHVSAAINAVLVDLASELKRSVDYYRSRAGDAPVHEVLLVGGSAKLHGLAPYLESMLDNIPTRVADPLQNVTVTAKQMSNQQLVDAASMFPVSIGLGARDLISVPGKSKKR